MRKLSYSVFADAALHRYGVAPCKAEIPEVLIVGGIHAPGARTQLSDNDDLHLSWIIAHGAREHNLRFSKNLRVQACNPVFGSSFPKDKPRAAFAAFSMIYYNPSGTAQGAIDKNYYRQPPENFVEGAWHEALMVSGAKWAANIHRNDQELPTGHLARDPFSLLSSTPMGKKRMDFVARCRA